MPRPQSLLFSATFSQYALGFARQIAPPPRQELLTQEEDVMLDEIEQTFISCLPPVGAGAGAAGARRGGPPVNEPAVEDAAMTMLTYILNEGTHLFDLVSARRSGRTLPCKCCRYG